MGSHNRASPRLAPCDSRFDSPEGWVPYDTSLEARNRYLLEDGLIWAETLFPLPATIPAAALEQLAGKWDWWSRGRITDFSRRRDGTVRQKLFPVWYYWVSVWLDARPAIVLRDEIGWRVPFAMSGHFTGPATNDVLVDPRLPNGCLVRGRFHGVRSTVPFFPDVIVAGAHLRAETGTLYPPFAFGTGFSGLKRRLEGGTLPPPLQYKPVLDLGPRRYSDFLR